jgi:hypothetical protein
MKRETDRTRRRAAATAAFLFLAGGVTGVTADRLWLNPSPLDAMPLTADAMADRLELSPAQTTQVRELLDSLHAEIAAVVIESPDSLPSVVQRAQLRIEATLPAASRSEFRAWMQEHHQHMRSRLHGGVMGAIHGGAPEGAHDGGRGGRP